MVARISTGQSVCALVVTYNRLPLLKQCIEAIMAQSYPISDLVIVDNASTDGTGEWLTGFSDRKQSDVTVHNLTMEENLGGAGGFMEGIRFASSLHTDWIWLMDDDCIPEIEALGHLVDDSLKPLGRPSFVASSVLGEHEEPMNVPNLSRRRHQNGYCDWYRYLTDGLVEIESATFVSLLINRECVDRVGLPNERFFIWGDDIEYTRRLTSRCSPAYLSGASKVCHKRKNARALQIETEADPIRLKNYRFLYRNNLVISERYEGKRSAFILFLRYLLKSQLLLIHGNGTIQARILRSFAVLRGIGMFLSERSDFFAVQNSSHSRK